MSNPAAESPSLSATGARARISVLITAYNVEHYIGQAIDSVLQQTRSDFELIVVDDGSTDRTAEIVRACRDPRIRFVRQSNAGSAAARNSGLDAATGDYVAFLDGDDVWLKDKLEVQAGWLDHHPETDLVFGATRIIDAAGRDEGRALICHSGLASFARMLTEDIIGNGSSQMLRREAVESAGRFDRDLPASVDHDLWLRVALLRPGNVTGLDRVVTLYRRRPGQISTDWRRKEQSWWKLLRKMEELAPEETATVRQAACANLYRVLSSLAYENGQYGEAGRLLLRAIRYHAPFLFSDRRTWLQTLAIVSSVTLPGALHLCLDKAGRRIRRQLGGNAS